MKNQVLSTEKYLRSLYVSNPIREPIIRTAISQLGIPAGSYGLDIGCGLGLYTLLLAEAVGFEGQVLGIDTTEEFLKKACSLASERRLEKSITFKNADASKLPFQDNTFDWAGSMDFVGYGNPNPVSLLREAYRVVKPGGMVFILMWSSQMLLPGYPLLEARLNATTSGIAPYKASMPPELHFMRALNWFHQIGFVEPIFRTFVSNISAPISSEMRIALTELFQMRWGKTHSEVSSEDWEKYQRLCHPGSPDFILNAPEYCAFITYSLFCGRVV